MSIVSELIGDELANALTPHQYDQIRGIAEEHPDGLRRVADEIRASSTIDKPVAVLLSRVNRGQAADRQRAATTRSTGGPHDARDWAHRLYNAKIAELHQHAPDWSEPEKREHAIDYALDHCRANGAHNLLVIETELRQEHGVQLTGTERDFERDTEHRRLMLAAHGPGSPNDINALHGEPEPVEADA